MVISREVTDVTKRVLSLFVLLVIIAAPAFAEDEASPMDIVAYPGSEIAMEVNMSNEDILPMLQALLPLLGAGKPELSQALNPEEISLILRDVRSVQYLQLEVRQGKSGIGQIADFYSTKLPGGGWSKVFYKASPDTVMAIYADPKAQAYYGFRARGITVDGKRMNQVDVARLAGRVDLVGLVKVAMRFFNGRSAASQPPA